MEIGLENTFFNYFLVIILIFYAVAIASIVRRSFKNKSLYKWNDLSLLIVLILIIIFISIPFKGEFLVPYPWNFFLVFFCGAYIFFLFIVGLFPPKESKIKKIEEQSELKKEFKRKAIHLASVGYFIGVLFGPLIMIGVSYIESIFIITKEYYESVYYLAYEKDPADFAVSFFIFIMIGSFFVQINAELLRLNWPDANFPLKKTLATVRRGSELNNFAAHPHMTQTWCLCAILFYYYSGNAINTLYLLFGVAMVSIFGDLYAALIGRKFGKHKWKFINNKSIEGTLAGFIASLFIGWIFLGFYLALVAALIFVITDIVLPKIIKINDNLMTPLLSTLAIIFILYITGNEILLLAPLFTISFIGIEFFPKRQLDYSLPTGFYGTFTYALLVIFCAILIGLIIAIKYRKKEIIFLFTGRKKDE
ncbi:MAG: hypothetical protein ACP6IY_13865 [Promethearchaeia archaeon]